MEKLTDQDANQDGQSAAFTSRNGYLPSGKQIKRVKVTLLGGDGNAFLVLAKVRQAMKIQLPNDIKAETMAAYQAETMNGDYDHLLMTTMRYCDID